MANFESGLTEGLVTAGRPCTGRAQWAACRAGYEAAVTQTRALFFPSDVVAPELFHLEDDSLLQGLVRYEEAIASR